LTCCSESAIRIAGGRAAGGEARAAATAQLGDELDSDRLHTLQLLLSEVVNNSVIHGGVDESGWIEVTIDADADRVRCAVRDPGKQGEPARRDPDLEHGGGFGLFLVEAMAARWGYERDPNLTVWFELDRSG
jgi:anti-sigma regulatory factor (Ser/Thr protein kinase)